MKLILFSLTLLLISCGTKQPNQTIQTIPREIQDSIDKVDRINDEKWFGKHKKHIHHRKVDWKL